MPQGPEGKTGIPPSPLYCTWFYYKFWAPQVALVVKKLPTSAGDARDAGLIPGLERSPRGRHGSPLQCTCLENPMDRGAWRSTVHMMFHRFCFKKKIVKVRGKPALCKSHGAALSVAFVHSCVCVKFWSFSCIPNMFIITTIFVTVTCDLWCYNSLKAQMTAFLAIKYFLLKGCTLFFQT